MQLKALNYYVFDGEHYYRNEFIYAKLKDEDKDVRYIIVFQYKDVNRFRKHMKIRWRIKLILIKIDSIKIKDNRTRAILHLRHLV